MRHLSSVVYEVISSAAVASKAIVGEDERKSWADISSDSDADAPGTSLSSGLKTSDVFDDVRLDDMPSRAASEALSTFTAAVTSGEIVRAGAMAERDTHLALGILAELEHLMAGLRTNGTST